MYNGRGARGVHEIMAPLRTKLPDYNVRAISTKETLKGNWKDSARLFILPGGIATPYTEDLESKGTDIIRDFVYDGGSFIGILEFINTIGICAGSYFAASSSEFRPFHDFMQKEIVTNRKLALSKSRAVGPVTPYDGTMNGVRSIPVELSTCMRGIEAVDMYQLN